VSAYQLLSLGFISGFGFGGLTILWCWRRVAPQMFGQAESCPECSGTGLAHDDAPG